MILERSTEIYNAIIANRDNYTGTDKAYAKMLGIDNTVYSRVKSGERGQMLSDGKLISIARILNVDLNPQKWIVARTAVYAQIESDITHCKNNASSLIFVDDCGIGKTFSSRHVVTKLQNAFYIDCSQCKTRQQFTRALAQAIGVDNTGKYIDIKKDIKYALNMLESPVVVLDEFGDVDYTTFLDIKEYWNGTDGSCGWYMMGADGLKNKIERGINNKKVGFREIFDRFNNKYMSAVPQGKEAREEFYALMIGDVLKANLPASEYGKINGLIKKIMGAKDESLKGSKDIEVLGGLRRAKTFVNTIKQQSNGAA